MRLDARPPARPLIFASFAHAVPHKFPPKIPMPKKPDIDALYQKALSLEAYASDLVEAAEAARIAYALAIRSQGKPDHDLAVKAAEAKLPAVDAAAVEALGRWAALVAVKKK